MFFNREEELRALLSLISYEPNMITFVYGPINSGKTVLLMELTKRISREFAIFYINLRGRFINSYEDFMKVLFSVKEGSLKEVLKSGLAYRGIPVPEKVFRDLIENENGDPFVFLEDYFRELRDRGRKPILVIDELQVIGDLKVDGPLIYKLFNFFVRLTKETRLSHVFVVTSDSLFIEKVYNEAMLQGRADYFLVDDFDKKTALDFLKVNGLSGDEAELVWSYFGGKPVYLVEALKHREELKEWCEGTLEAKFHWLLYSLNSLRRTNKELFEEVLSLLRKFRENEEVECLDIDDAVAWTVKNNILFLDPRRGILRPQGRLELLAIRRALEKL